MPKIISGQHDRFFRASMSNPHVAKEFFQTYLPENIQRITNLSSLELQKESFVDKALRSHVTDMLYSVEINHQPSYLYLLVEHQSTSDPLMPFRLLKYSTLAIDQHLKQHGGTELPLIYPLVLYNGAKKYTYSTDLFTLFNQNETLARQVFLQPFHLIDLSQISDENLKQQAWLSILLLCLKHTMERDALRWIGSMLDNLCIVEQEGGIEYANTAFAYLFLTGAVSDTNTFMQTIHNHLSPNLEKNMITIAQQFEEIGLQRGRQEGQREGQQEGREQMMQKFVSHLFVAGKSAKEIAQLLGLPLETILAIQHNQ